MCCTHVYSIYNLFLTWVKVVDRVKVQIKNMKKILSIGLIFIVTNSVFADDAFNVNLKYGMRGADVVEMQEFLIDQGFLTGSATGNFYSVTLRAVKAFQKANNLSTSGFWGPLSRQKANELIDLGSSKKEEVENPIKQPTTTQSVAPIIQPVQIITVPVQTTPTQTQTAVSAPIPDTYSLSIQEVTVEGGQRYSVTATKNGLEIGVKKCLQINPNATIKSGTEYPVAAYGLNPNLKLLIGNYVKNGWQTECELEDGKLLTN